MKKSYVQFLFSVKSLQKIIVSVPSAKVNEQWKAILVDIKVLIYSSHQNKKKMFEVGNV